MKGKVSGHLRVSTKILVDTPRYQGCFQNLKFQRSKMSDMKGKVSGHPKVSTKVWADALDIRGSPNQ